MKYTREDKFTKPETPKDVLELALAKEQSSFEFYQELIRFSQNTILLKLLRELRDAELGHIKKIKAKLQE